MDQLVYLLAGAGMVVGIALGFILSGLWIVAVPSWRQHRHRQRGNRHGHSQP